MVSDSRSNEDSDIRKAENPLNGIADIERGLEMISGIEEKTLLNFRLLSEW